MLAQDNKKRANRAKPQDYFLRKRANKPVTAAITAAIPARPPGVFHQTSAGGEEVFDWVDCGVVRDPSEGGGGITTGLVLLRIAGGGPTMVLPSAVRQAIATPL